MDATSAGDWSPKHGSGIDDRQKSLESARTDDRPRTAVKKFVSIADGRGVSSTGVHDLPGSELELLGLARFWLWERHVKENLPRILVDGELRTVFQPIYKLTEHGSSIGGYEALTRFPSAPGIPVALWFRVAVEIGYGTQLEIAAARTALKSAELLPSGALLFLNSSVDAVNELIGVIDAPAATVIDIPMRAVRDPDLATAVRRLRREGLMVSIDDVPLSSFHALRDDLGAIEPDFVKVDVLEGLAHNVMGRFNLAEGAVWCHDNNVEIVAERAERQEDLVMLFDLGVDWAQGFSLSEPIAML